MGITAIIYNRLTGQKQTRSQFDSVDLGSTGFYNTNELCEEFRIISAVEHRRAAHRMGGGVSQFDLRRWIDLYDGGTQIRTERTAPQSVAVASPHNSDDHTDSRGGKCASQNIGARR